MHGVEGLIPNGRNVDGSLNNTKFTVDKVLTRTIIDAGTRNDITVGFSPYVGNSFGFSLNVVYNEYNNLNIDNDQTWDLALIGKASYSNTKITSFSPKTTFQAVDRSDTEWASTAGKPSDRYVDLTLGASGAIYTAPANGYFTITKKAGDNAPTSTLWIAFTDLSNRMRCEYRSPIGATSATLGSLIFPVVKGHEVKLEYTFTGETTYFCFVYDEGVK